MRLYRPALRHLYRVFLRAWSDPHVHLLLVLGASLLATGATFYHFVEGWRWLDAFYFSAVTLSTVGYGDFHPVTAIGKIFTVIYLFFGIGVFVGIFSFVSRAASEPEDRDASVDGR